MLHSLSLRLKIMIALLGLSLLPLLLVSIFFSQITDSHFSEELKEKAQRTKRFVLESSRAMQTELMADIKPLQENPELINAVYFSQLTGDATRLAPILKKLKQTYDLERIELLNQDGILYSLSKEQNSLEKETLTAEEQENLSQVLKAGADNHFQLIRGDLTLTAGVPISLQGKVIARLNGFRIFTDATANHLHTLIGTEIAFHNGNRVVATSNQRLTQFDLPQILNHQLLMAVSNDIPYALFPSSLPDNQGGFYLAIDRAEAQRAQSSMQQTLLIVLVIVFFLAATVAVIVSRGITTPLQQVVGNLHQIAEGAGDLTRTLPITSGDEVGALAKSFNRLMASLREMITHFHTATQNVSDAARQIGDRSAEMNNDAGEQSRALEKSHLAIKEINGMAGEITDNVSSLVASVQESAAATQQFGSTTTGISEQMENLFAITSEISSSIHQLSSSNQQIEGNVSALSQNTQETAESIRQMDEATRAIDVGAKETQQLVVLAAEKSLEGKSAVMDTIRGISGLQQTIEQAHLSIRELGNRSDAIGNIINVIAEIADQTNLLALNAAIIAAQAGEHGKGFAVVANEIRSLAERTSTSTDEITGIVESLQEGTRMAANAIEAGSIKAEQEVARSQTAGEALEKLHKSAVTSRTQVKKITDLARHQTEASHVITQAVINITETLQQVATSISQQGSSTRHLANAAEQMTGISARVKNSTNEQKRGSQQIAMAMELIQETIEKIHSATLQQNESSQQAIKVVAQAAEISENNAQRSAQFNQIVKTLSVQTKSLQKNIGTFKI